VALRQCLPDGRLQFRESSTYVFAEVHAKRPSPALRKYRKIAARLRRFDHPKRIFLFRDWDIVGIVASDLQEDTAVGSAFIGLACRVQKPRPKSQHCRQLLGVSDRMADALESGFILGVHRDVAEHSEEGYLHCGPSGAGHFVKMVHNGIEYALMAAYAEGLNILKHANAGSSGTREVDAETTPLRNPENYRYDFSLADVSEVWRRGSVVASWLLDLTAISLLEQPSLERFSGRVSDSGEGRWTILAAIESTAPAPVLTASLFQRFVSRGEDEFAAKLLSAMRFQFGGHMEKAASAK